MKFFFSIWGVVIWEYLKYQVTILQSEFWTCCDLLNPKSMSHANKELQQSNLLTKPFAKRTENKVFESRLICIRLWYLPLSSLVLSHCLTQTSGAFLILFLRKNLCLNLIIMLSSSTISLNIRRNNTPVSVAVHLFFGHCWPLWKWSINLISQGTPVQVG